jgi:hypothetical protein
VLEKKLRELTQRHDRSASEIIEEVRAILPRLTTSSAPR